MPPAPCAGLLGAVRGRASRAGLCGAAVPSGRQRAGERLSALLSFTTGFPSASEKETTTKDGKALFCFIHLFKVKNVSRPPTFHFSPLVPPLFFLIVSCPLSSFRSGNETKEKRTGWGEGSKRNRRKPTKQR